MPRDEPVTVPLEVRLLLRMTGLSLEIKVLKQEIAELKAHVAKLEAAHEK
jgi:hypothetical protein